MRREEVELGQASRDMIGCALSGCSADVRHAACSTCLHLTLVSPSTSQPHYRLSMADNTQPPPPNADAETVDDLDAGVEGEINTEGTQQPDAMNLDGANDTEAPQRNGVAENPIEARIPAKKDATLREFLSKMDDFAPIVCLAPPRHTTNANPPSRYQTLSPTTT